MCTIGEDELRWLVVWVMLASRPSYRILMDIIPIRLLCRSSHVSTLSRTKTEALSERKMVMVMFCWIGS